MRFDSIIPKQIVKLLLGLMLTITPLMSQHAVAQSPDAAMMPEKGENTGELRRGELLVTALKREKIESSSIRLAMQSMGQLFDFRLSRAGDKYLYRLGNGRKLVMLRYQRGQHIYESVLDSASNSYKSQLLDMPSQLPAIPDVIEHASGSGEEDGEVDVEHAALAQKAQPELNTDTNPVEDSQQNSLNTLNQLEVALPDDPLQPTDSALAGIPSPDDEFPERPGFAPTDEDGNADTPSGDILNPPNLELHEEDLRENVAEVPDLPVQMPSQQVLPDVSTPIVEHSIPVKTLKIQERESTTFSTISLVMFVCGAGLFLLAFLMFWIPSIRVRARCRKQGLRIVDMISVAPGMRLLRVQTNGYDCIVAAYANSMSFIAPCPPEDEKLWQHIKAKSNWYQMAQNPISDRQLKAIVQAFYTDNPNDVSGLHESSEHVTDVKITEMPTARAVPDLSDFDDLDDA